MNKLLVMCYVSTQPQTDCPSLCDVCMCRHIQNMCMGCRTVVSVIHQPSSEVFGLFNELCLLANGQVMVFGKPDQAAINFKSVGLPIPEYANPAEHFLHCINADFEVRQRVPHVRVSNVAHVQGSAMHG